MPIKRAKKIIKMIEAYLAAGILVAAVLYLLNYMVNNTYTHNLTKAILQDYINENLNIDLDYESINLSVIPLSIEFSAVKIRLKNAKEQPALFKMSHANIRVSWIDLALKEKKIQKISITDADIFFSNQINYGNIFKENTTPAVSKNKNNKDLFSWYKIKKGKLIPFLPIDEITLNQVSFFGLFTGPQKDSKELSLNDLNLHIHKIDRHTIHLAYDLEHLFYKENSEPIVSDWMLKGKILWDSGTIVDSSLDLKGQDISLNGQLNSLLSYTQKEGITDYGFKLKAKGHSDLSYLGKFLKIPKTHGYTEIDSEINYHSKEDKNNPLLIKAKAKFKDSIINDIKLHEFESELTIDQDRIVFDNIDLGIQGHIYGSAKGFIGFSDEVPFEFTGELSKIPSETVFDLFNLEFDVVKADLSTQKLKVSGKGAPYSMVISAPIAIEHLQVDPDLHLGPIKDSGHPPISCFLNFQMLSSDPKLTFDGTNGICDEKQKDPQSQQNIITLANGFYFEKDNSVKNNLDIVLKKISPQLINNLFGTKIEQGELEDHIHIADKNNKTLVIHNFKLDQFGRKTNPVNAHGIFSLQQEKVFWQDVHLQWSTNNLLHCDSGSINTSDLFGDFSCSASNLPTPYVEHLLDQLNIKLDLAVQSVLDKIQFTYKGLLDKPFSATGSLVGSISDLTLKGTNISEKINISMTNSGDGWQSSQFSWKLRNQTFQLHIDQGKNQQTNEQKEIENKIFDFFTQFGLPINHVLNLKIIGKQDIYDRRQIFSNLPYIAEYLKDNKIEGHFNTEIFLTLSQNKLNGYFKTNTKNIYINEKFILPLTITGDMVRGKCNLNINHGPDILLGRISLDLFQDGIPFQWYFSFNNLDTRVLFPVSIATDPKNYSYISGSWELKGFMNQWWQSTGKLSIDNIIGEMIYEANHKPYFINFKNEKPLKINMSKDGWNINSGEDFKINSEFFTLKLKSNKIVLPHTIDVTIQSDIKLDLFAKIFNQLESAEGSIYLDSKLMGSIDNLIFSGSVKGEEADKSPIKISIVDLGPELTDINVDVSWDKEKILVKNISGKKGPGNFALSGIHYFSAETNNSNKIHLVLQKTKFKTSVPILKSFEFDIDGQLTFEGAKPPYKILGDLNFVSAKSITRADLAQEMLNNYRQTYTAPNYELTSKNLFDIDININNQSPIKIKNKNLNLSLDQDLKILGNEKRIILMGNMKINKGSVFFKRDFQIVRGEIFFDDLVKIDPKIDLIAEADIDSYNVQILVTGTSSKPQLEIIVDPSTRENGMPITRMEALILITRGSLPRIDEGSTDFQGLGISEVINVYASQIPFEQLSIAMGQDIIEIYPNFTTDENGSPVLQLSVPIKITNKINGVYRQTPNKSEFSVEVPLHKNISVSGNAVQLQNGQSTETEVKDETSLNLKFKFPFD